MSCRFQPIASNAARSFWLGLTTQAAERAYRARPGEIGQVTVALEAAGVVSNDRWFRRADGTPFYFDGADFWSRRGLDATGNFYFVLSLKGKVVYLNPMAGKILRMDAVLRKRIYCGIVMVFKVRFVLWVVI